MLRPHVVIYSAVGIDGRITGYENDPAGVLPLRVREPGRWRDPRDIGFHRTGAEQLGGGEVVLRYAATARTTPSGVDS